MSSLNRETTSETTAVRFDRAKKTMEDIKNLLKNAKFLNAIKSSQLVLELQPVSLKYCLDEIYAMYTDRLEDKKLSLSINWPDDAKDYLVLAESLSLKHQVIGNLLTNAIKFSHKGGEIRIDVVNLSSKIVISIKDQGIGMPQEILENIFNEDTNITRPGTLGEKGSGCGLPLVFQYIKAYQGDIKVISHLHDQQKQGTEFELHLNKTG